MIAAPRCSRLSPALTLRLVATTIERFKDGRPAGVLLQAMPLGSGHRQIGLPTHAHTFQEVLLVTAGSGVHIVSGHSHRMARGQLYALSPGVTHEILAGSDAIGWVAIFEPVEMLPSGGELLRQRAHPLLRAFQAPPPLQLTHRQTDDLATLMGQLANETSARHEGWEAASLALLQLVLVHTARIAGPHGVDFAPLTPLAIDVLEVIESEFRNPLSLRDIAAVVHRDPSRLTTTIRVQTGRSINDWIEERRMIEARRQLATADVPIARIAVDIGFNDHRYFSRRFRLHHGVSPAEWRTANRYRIDATATPVRRLTNT